MTKIFGETQDTRNDHLHDLEAECKSVVGESIGLFKDLFTPKLAEKVKEIEARLENENPVINPGRSHEMKWNDSFPNSNNNPFVQSKNDNLDRQKRLILITMALDETYADQFIAATSKIEQVNNKDKTKDSGLMHDLAAQGQIEHIENEMKAANYHRSYHPQESAVVASHVAATAVTNKKELVSELVGVSFEHHDVDQAHVKTDGVNELRSADRLAKNWKDKVVDTEYQKLIPYMAWKTIVAGTTMMKGVDGQPTVHLAQQLIERQLVEQGAIQQPKKSVLDDATWVMGVVDSNLPALVKVVQENPSLKQALPNHLIHDNEVLGFANTSVKKLVGSEQAVVVNEAGLAFGQNARMFPELHATYGGALTKVKLDNGMNGVEAWNAVIEAVRTGDAKRFSELLAAKSTEDLSVFDASPIVKGSSMLDVFIHRLKSELEFSEMQGPELYAKGATSNMNVAALQMNTDVWRQHKARLEALQNASPEARVELAKAFFALAGNQPGVFLPKEKLVKNIDARLQYWSEQEKVIKAETLIQGTSSPHATTGNIVRELASDYSKKLDSISQHKEMLMKSEMEYKAIPQPKSKLIQVPSQGPNISPTHKSNL